MITGRVAYLHAFDISYDVRRPGPTRLLGRELVPQRLESGKRVPRSLSFDRPLSAVLAPVQHQGPRGPVLVDRVVRVLPVGSLSVTVLVPFQVEDLSELVAYHDLTLDGKPLIGEVQRLAAEALAELRPFLMRPVDQLADEETYTVFCVDASSMTAFNGAAWLAGNRRQVAALLTQEEDHDILSDAEVEESTARSLSYYRGDLAVIDWDAALLIDSGPSLDDALLVMELANVELAELESYDRLLDQVVERCYPDIGGSWLRSRNHIVRELGEVSVDLARMRDELGNATKLHGDYHLARLHRLVSERFHLADWQRTVEDKLETVDGIYQHLRHDLNNRWMLVLELSVVLIFLFDIYLIMTGHG